MSNPFDVEDRDRASEARAPEGPSVLARVLAAVMRFVSAHRVLLAIVFVGAVIRVAVNDVARYSPADEAHYLDATRSLLKNGWGSYPALVRSYLEHSDEWLYPTPTRWGYLGLTVITCAVRAPCDGRALAWLSTVAGVLSIVLTYLLGARLLGRRAALVAAAFTISSPLQLALGRRALQDEVYCAIFLGAFWALVRLLQIDAPGHETPARAGARRGAIAAFVGIAALAFAVKETFAFPYAGLVALYVLAPRARRLGLSDVLVLAAPPAIFVAGFASWSRDPGAFFRLVEIGQASFLSEYSVQYQSGPPHRPLFDLFVLAPIVCLLAAGALTQIAVRKARGAPGGERWLALFLVIALAAFMGLPKNARFVVLLDPIVRLLAAWLLLAALEARDLRPRWAIAFVFASVAAELALFHATFIAHKTYDPTTHDVLRALDALPRPSARAAPSTWPPVFFAATALGVAGIFLSRRRTVTKTHDSDEDSESGPASGSPDAESKPREDSTSATAERPSGAGETPRAATDSQKPAQPTGTDADPSKGAPASRERVATIAIAVACVVVALFIGRSCGQPGPQGGLAGAASASSSAAAGADPAAAEINAGLQAQNAGEAVLHFRKALEINPQHYGATFQLARALDRAGRKDEATRQWQQVLALAEQSRDQPLVETAKQRLAQVGAAPGGAAPGDPMTAGLDALHNKRDPATAIARFREVLAQSPEHYGATYQLATALEMAGDARSARPVWEKMLKMAEAIQDAATVETARARLAEIDKVLGPAQPPDPDEGEMKAGMDALYNQKDPAAAAARFRKVLARNATHYGATFQLATALDQLKKPAEARPHWQKILEMAEAIQDTKTADTARARLAQKP